jgi:hypothetical protein
MALQTQCNQRDKISEANGRRMVSNASINRETPVDDTPRYKSSLGKLGFEEEKEQPSEWIIVANRARQKVASRLDLSLGSFTNSAASERTQRNANQRTHVK